MVCSRQLKIAVLAILACLAFLSGLCVQQQDYRTDTNLVGKSDAHQQSESMRLRPPPDPVVEQIQQRELYTQDQRLHIARNHKFTYVHIPKTGGTTVEDSSLFDHKRHLGMAPRSHHTVRALSNASKTDGFLVATHIRNPCDRFMSAFLYLRYDQRSEGWRQRCQDFGMYGVDSTEQFVSWLDKSQSWDALKSAFPHFAPLTHWLVHQDGSFGADVVMCQEEWEEGVERLVDSLNLNFMPQNLLFKKRKNGAHTKSCSDLEPAVVDRIQDEFAMDACLFGYDKYGRDEWAIEGRNETQCIGTQFGRTWFSQRLRFCKERLSRATAIKQA